MNALLFMRDKFSLIYGKHDISIRIVLKFFMAFITFTAINGLLGQMEILNHPAVVAGAALICAFLPSNSMLLVAAVMMGLHFYGISLETAVAGGGMLLILLLLYFSINSKSAFPLIFGAIGCGIGLPGGSAVVCGLTGGPLSAVGAAFGVLVYNLAQIVNQVGPKLEATSADAADAMVEKMVMLINAVFTRTDLLLLAGTVAVCMWLIMAVREMAVPFAWMIASVLGLVVFVASQTLGCEWLGYPADYEYILLNVGSGILFAWLAQTFLHHLSFKKTETVRFEDDDYFYYVKAVPKSKIVRTKRARKAERR